MILPGLLVTAVHAAGVSTFSPQGEVRSPQQMRISFATSMVPLGNTAAPAPLVWQCGLKGQGRWVDDKSWVLDVEGSLPARTDCRISLKPGLKDQAGVALSAANYRFFTGAPIIEESWPEEGDRVAEDQAFVLRYNGKPPAAASLSCLSSALGERLPMQALAATDRQVLLKHLKQEKQAANILTVRCGQRLAPGSKLTVFSPRDDAQPERRDFRVRAAFNATLSCPRESAKGPCIPFKPVVLRFSSDVPVDIASAIRLKGEAGERQPQLDSRHGEAVSEVRFDPPFAPLSSWQITLPANMADEVGRKLQNAARFPLALRFGDYPPLAKFAAAPFGIIESMDEPALPLTLRGVEAGVSLKSVSLDATQLRVSDDQSIMRWLGKTLQYHESTLPAGGDKRIETRRVSMLGKARQAVKLPLPLKPDAKGKWPFEVVGIPLRQPGLHVVELKSQLLGKALLAANKPMYVRTAALVTNMAVHFKQSPENAAVWVSTLDGGKPVAEAEIRIYNCARELLWQGKTGKQGMVTIAQSLETAHCEQDDALDGLFVIARSRDSKGRDDVSFVRSGWNQGIESWRFPFPTGGDASSSVIAHTILDRPLFRSGETVSMKHLLRQQHSRGLKMLAAADLPQKVRIVHQGSDDEYSFDLLWRKGRYADTVFKLPPEAKLGEYSIYLQRKGSRTDAQRDMPSSLALDGYELYSGSFRVEAFRLPLMRGVIRADSKLTTAASKLPLQLSLSWGTGGAAGGWPLTVSAMLEDSYSSPAGYEQFSFNPPQTERDDAANVLSGKVLLDKAGVKLDAAGNGSVSIDNIPKLDRRYLLLTEAAYRDPNGEIQTVSRRIPLWPAALQVGIQIESWIKVGRKVSLKAVVLDTAGKPVANRKVEVRQVLQQYLSSRKRLVGGFYAWEHEQKRDDKGEICAGRTDSRGLLLCDVTLGEAGNLSLEATVKDDKGNSVTAAQEVWVSQHDELWFDADNNDRIDILPERPDYKVGDIARFQVRMPFRKATAWVAIERDGIVETRVLTLSGDEPVIELKVEPDWTPNVYVSVLAVRGRLRDVPWYSFFSWGWKSPLQWWDAFWNEGRDYVAPTNQVDLAKPAFKYGVAEIRVDDAANRLQISVEPQRSRYGIREVANVTLRVKLPNGKPAPAGTELTFAAVDESLLALQPNNSWDVMAAMFRRHPYSVETATAQLEVVGKRHYGRKALPPGGGGGKAPTRELLDTLLLWQPAVVLGEGGVAQIKVPINDALTRFWLVAVADSGNQLFGMGSAYIDVVQDVQLVAGLPPLVRSGDQYAATVTVRNGSDRAMSVTVKAAADGIASLAVQTVSLPAGQSRELSWPVTVPLGKTQLDWTFSAQEAKGKGVDKLAFTQQVAAAVPVVVTQASLQRLAAPLSLPVALPPDALPGQGGVRVSLQARLGRDLPAVRDWFAQYPFSCFEQRSSVAVGLGDDKRWQALMTELPLHQDHDGLLAYFPLGEGARDRGSDVLTSYVLNVAAEAGYTLPEPGLGRALSGLAALVEGRLRRELPISQQAADGRRLAAMLALSQHGRFRPAMLDVLTITPQSWSSAMLIDWLALLQRESAIAQRDVRLAEASQLLRARLNYQGARMVMSGEQNENAWWLMGNADVNAARLLLVTSRLPDWQADLPRLLTGLLARQQKGHWQTTTANTWGTLAVAGFSSRFERDPVNGQSRVTLGKAAASASWSQEKPTALPLLAWPAGKQDLQLTHSGSGAPWATIQTEAALVLKAPRFAGYRLSKQITAVSQKQAGRYQPGDVLKVSLEIDAQSDMGWVVLDDPVPAGATVLGSGLGGDSAMAAAKADDGGADFVERPFGRYRAYFAYLPRGKQTLSYTMRLNNPGVFQLPPTRVEAMYAPDVFGMLPNKALRIDAGAR